MRIVFLGTPEFAVPTLHALAHRAGWNVVAVVCQPDRPAGRGGALREPAVKRAATGLGLPVYQPARMRSEESVAWLAAQRPDVLAVVAYGQLLPATVFDMPRWGAINAHASLLPAYRGAAPIQWAIANGEVRTGVTTMRINAGLDTGDMLLQRAIDIPAHATAPELSLRLADLAAELMVETFHRVEYDEIDPQPQPEMGTLAPRLTREDGRADWSRPAQELYNRWRGFLPWPGLHTRWRGRQFTIVRCQCASEADFSLPPGRLFARDAALWASCGSGRLRLEEVRVEGRQAVAGGDFARGARLPESGEPMAEDTVK